MVLEMSQHVLRGWGPDAGDGGGDGDGDGNGDGDATAAPAAAAASRWLGARWPATPTRRRRREAMQLLLPMIALGIGGAGGEVHFVARPRIRPGVPPARRDALIPSCTYADACAAPASAAPWGAAAAGGAECSICLTEFDAESRVRLLPCRHVYHERCIDRWLDRSRKCPSCRHCVLDEKEDLEV